MTEESEEQVISAEKGAAQEVVRRNPRSSAARITSGCLHGPVMSEFHGGSGAARATRVFPFFTVSPRPGIGRGNDNYDELLR